VRAAHPPEFGLSQRIAAGVAADVDLLSPHHNRLALGLLSLALLFTSALLRLLLRPLILLAHTGTGLLHLAW